MRQSCSWSSWVQRDRHGETPDQLGDEPEALEILGLDAREHLLALVLGCVPMVSPANPILRLPMRASTIFSRPSNAPPQTNRMLRVLIWMYSCCGCLRPPCGRHARDRPLQDLEQRLLHALRPTRRG
jgi:hypothetical protein